MATYDEALFAQGLKRRACFGAVTVQQVADAFWESARDLEHNIATLKPERLDEARAKVLHEVAPRLQLPAGYRLV